MTDAKNFAESLEGKFLAKMREEQLELNIYLVNGIRLKGVIDDFNDSAIFLRNGNVQMVRYSAVSTIMPISAAADAKTDLGKSS